MSNRCDYGDCCKEHHCRSAATRRMRWNESCAYWDLCKIHAIDSGWSEAQWRSAKTADQERKLKRHELCGLVPAR